MKSTSKMFKALLGGGILLLLFALVGQAAAQTCTPPPMGLVSWWPVDGTAEDIVGGNDGTVVGGATFAAGRVDQAVDLNGSSGYVRVPDDPSLDTPDGFTIDAWVYPRSFGGSRDIASKWDDPTDQWSWIFKLHNDGSGRLRIEISRGDHNALGDLGGVAVLPLNTWSHVAATYDRVSGRLRLYVNGNLDSSGVANFPGTPINNSATDILIGAVNGQVTSPDEHFDGLIDELELFNRELAAAEIQAVFAAGSAGKCKVTTVAIDIKPSSFPNSINPKIKGTIPVAILTTDTFDATTVDSTTVLFGATGTEAAPVQFALEDVDGDGDTDLILHFNTQETGIVCGDTFASLTGETLGGQAIQGADSIRTVKCK